jgi:RluA family pseudouridine synthase
MTSFESPQADRRRARVPAPAAGQRLDRFLVEHFPRYSRRRIAEVVRRGEVLVNGRAGRPGTILAEGDVLELPALAEAMDREARNRRARTRLREAARVPTEVRVVHEDEDLLVVDKPAGVPMHGGAGLGGVETLVDLLRERVLAGFGLVHRLDRDTTGLVALVRGEDLRARAAERFADPEGGVQKVYETIVSGVPEPREGRIDLPLAPPGHGGRAEVDRAHGKPAVTTYEVLEDFGEAARLKVEPRTGRTHQIRAHLAAIGHPLLVDPLYAGRGGLRLVDPRRKLDAHVRRTPLHAHALALPHPRTGEPLRFEAPVPGDMKYALEVLRVRAGRRRKHAEDTAAADDAPTS